MNTPQNAFICHIGRSLQHVEDLKDELERLLEGTPRDVQWEHAGDAKHIELTLEALLTHTMGRTQ